MYSRKDITILGHAFHSLSLAKRIRVYIQNAIVPVSTLQLQISCACRSRFASNKKSKIAT